MLLGNTSNPRKKVRFRIKKTKSQISCYTKAAWKYFTTEIFSEQSVMYDGVCCLLPVSTSTKLRLCISRNHSSISFSKHFNQKCHSFGRKQFANKPEMKNKGVTTTGSTLITICTQSGLQDCWVNFYELLKNKQTDKLFSLYCQS